MKHLTFNLSRNFHVKYFSIFHVFKADENISGCKGVMCRYGGRKIGRDHTQVEGNDDLLFLG